jgi:hypothetical protein
VSFIKRASQGPKGVAPDGAPLDCVLSAAYPAVAEFITLTAWPEGERRTPGTVLLCWDDGRWRACVKDRAQARQAWLSAQTLDSLFQALEGALRADSLEWRRDTWAEKKRHR